MGDTIKQEAGPVELLALVACNVLFLAAGAVAGWYVAWRQYRRTVAVLRSIQSEPTRRGRPWD